MAFSGKSDEEIGDLLTEHGIKHGPIVETTRSLYEKKLGQAMEEGPDNPSSDKTFYREEEEEITYITYQNPVRHEPYGDMLKRRGHNDEDDDQESDQDPDPPVQTNVSRANHSSAPSREPVSGCGGCAGGMTRRLLLLAVLAAVCYLIYSWMLNDAEGPSGVQ